MLVQVVQSLLQVEEVRVGALVLLVAEIAADVIGAHPHIDHLRIEQIRPVSGV